ncbi:phosphotransferase enzyme family protein [Amycolatopsis taiwanensis]|uniref:Aminoglycoside phosphotransferase domain-containing protein n=1 Tax=Amycolatopsis taiwanensis TaxID=342230 RepID=A0A9W6QWF5_9PSEU|nr:aminoglycoside phosphotransferase family protein [Amycolatopsis taiwanensis]GLY63658.1 hypothetical protein Atai01_02770 [Amycolatopsis taiwanensis]
MVDGPETFTSQRTQAVLKAACETCGLDPAGARLLRFGENAIYGLDRDPVVVRIGRSVDAANKETRVAKWLELNHFPAARLAPGHGEVFVIDGLPLTFWERIPDDPAPITPAEFGKVLHDLHALPVPDWLDLPSFEPMPKIVGRVNAIPSGYLPASDLEFLLRRYEEISAKYNQLDFALPPGPVHGDAHPGNVMRALDGTLRLIDFEDFAYGPREWDACVMAVRYQAFGWTSDEEYRSYVEAYGFDPIEWSGFSVIRAARELNMTTWLAQTVHESEEVAVEVRKRIRDLRDDQAPRHWRVF